VVSYFGDCVSKFWTRSSTASVSPLAAPAAPAEPVYERPQKFYKKTFGLDWTEATEERSGGWDDRMNPWFQLQVEIELEIDSEGNKL
jgi:hypothetical protein